MRGLAEAFQTAFKDSIIPNEDRLRFWIDNRERIERTTYIRSMILGMQEHVKEKSFDRIGECLVVLRVGALPSRPTNPRAALPVSLSFARMLGGELREDPDWRSLRWAVGDLIGSCLKEDAPISARGQLAKLLEMLCTQFDRDLDQDGSVMQTQKSQLGRAINSPRGRALQDLVSFGVWVRST